jgi:long-chain acyl-CoA synthetase
MPISYSSQPVPPVSSASALDYDPDSGPVLVEPELRRLDGEVREVAVPPLVPPVTHGSLADLPFENAAAVPGRAVLSRRAADGAWTDVTAAGFAAEGSR